ncbi:MAG: integrase core domain-containing protein [Actinomycetota bacterium]|nr:integrase core domain-containing protein [Actinomycetota bacterium]
MGLSGPVPRRVDAATKASLLTLIDQATAAGWEHRRACGYLELAESRAWRWYERREAGRLEDRSAGGNAVHGLLADERDAIITLFDTWGETDRSHRKLAHRGSYQQLVWVSPATVRRVLAANGLVLRRPRRAGRSERRPFPEWATYTKHSIWIYDTTHFARCPRVAVITIMDLVTRKWICEIISGEETSTQVQVAFCDALELEGLHELVAAHQDSVADPLSLSDDVRRPILLAVSDNGPQMTSGSTREFMAMCAIAQHFGRPGTPTDQAWIESLFSHIKADWPHLDAITDPAVLRAELAIVRVEYNTVRLHAGIGYVTPDDEHEGRGPQIRRARRVGLMRARRQRIAYHRQQRHQRQPPQTR